MTTTRGGARQGAGRKKSKEHTHVKRVPASLLGAFDTWIDHYKTWSANPLPHHAMPFKASVTLAIPVFADKVQAGFPSPAEPYISNYLDFNTYLVSNPSATFSVYADGESMIDAGINKGDLLVVDRSLDAKCNDIVVAEVDNEFTVKYFVKTNQGIALHPANSSGKYPVITPTEHMEIRLVGVVTHIIKKVG